MPQHCTPEQLAAEAVDGSALPPDRRAHLDSCRQCRNEVERYEYTAGQLQRSRDVEMLIPPQSVWQSIADATRDRAAPLTTASTTTSSDLADARTARDRRLARSGTASRWLSLGVAAAVGALVGGVVVGAVRVSQTPPPAQVVASAQLAALPEGGVRTAGTGTAEFEVDADGNDILVVRTQGLETPGGFYQVWLLDPATSGLVPVGVVRAGDQQTTFPLPPGISPTQFPVIDISDEPIDGDPGHSKVSVLRGELGA